MLPKPADWGDHVDVCGFALLSSASNYKPPDNLVSFIKGGSTPIYVGFGSITGTDPQALTDIVFRAIADTGQRAIVSAGWGRLGADRSNIPESVFLLEESCPHDWLFRHVSCVVHHGGAGTTASGLALGCPTVIVPFFGDQPFWGSIVERAGAGPTPIPHKLLTSEKLSAAIREALKPEMKETAREISKQMQHESGTECAVRSFHRHIDLDRVRCPLSPSRAAVWWLKGPNGIALSAFAAAVLVNEGLIHPRSLDM